LKVIAQIDEVGAIWLRTHKEHRTIIHAKQLLAAVQINCTRGLVSIRRLMAMV